MTTRSPEEEIAAIVAPLSRQAAMSILLIVADQILASISAELGAARPPRRRYLVGRAHPSRVDLDPEVRAYVLSLPEPMTIARLRAELTTRFGEDRTPSKSSIHRYLQKLERGYKPT